MGHRLLDVINFIIMIITTTTHQFIELEAGQCYIIILFWLMMPRTFDERTRAQVQLPINLSDEDSDKDEDTNKTVAKTGVRLS